MSHGAELMAFAEAIVRDSETLPDRRAAVVATLGPAAMVRIADSTGIELGAFLDEATVEARRALGLVRPAER